MPSTTTAIRRLFVQASILMMKALASRHGVCGGTVTVENSYVPRHDKMPNGRNHTILKADLPVLAREETSKAENVWVPTFKADLPAEKLVIEPYHRPTLLIHSTRDPVQEILDAQDVRGYHEMRKEEMSPEIKAELNTHQLWRDFLYDVLQHSDGANNNDDTKLLQPIVFRHTAREYQECARKCDFFHPYGNSFYETMFPDRPQRQQLYCSICHSELIRIAKNKAESLLEGVSREAAAEGCWDSEGVLHQPGEDFEVECSWCTCGRDRQVGACTLIDCWHWESRRPSVTDDYVDPGSEFGSLRWEFESLIQRVLNETGRIQ